MADARNQVIPPEGFAAAVDNTLGPLLLDAGFRPDVAVDYEVSFRKESVRVVARYGGPPGGELSILIVDDRSDERPLELGDVLRATGFPEKDMWQANMQTYDADGISRLLLRGADLLATHGRAFLDGSEELFVSARAERAARWQAYARRVSVSSRTLDQADAGWQEKNYELVREILASVRDRLDVTRLRRLDFAERRTAGGAGR